MRTLNCKCIICDKPLYRRPFELKKVRYVACMEHRVEAQKLYPLTEKQKEALSLGREKGTNHLEGIPKSKESNEKRSIAHKKWCAENSDKVVARGKKIRGKNHYLWKGGSSKINQSVRLMTENRKWMDIIKERDGCCQKCGSTENLESHHIIPLSQLIEKYGISSRDDAYKHKNKLWDINNGITLCSECHCDEHGRAYTPPTEGRKYRPTVIKDRTGKNNPNWKGGLIEKKCLICGISFDSKPSEGRKYCSRRCANESRRKYLQVNA